MFELLNIDCMAYMASCDDNAFDLALVDPPYGIGNFLRDTYTGADGKRRRNGNYHKFEWNDKPPPPEYFTELRRVSRNQIIFGANYLNCFESGGALVWYKGNQTQTISHCEIASQSLDLKTHYLHVDWQAGFHRSQQGMQIHPCQKPTKLYRWILERFADPGQKVLDTHLGSGSSAIAAHYFGCDFVGCEIDNGYFEKMVTRFNIETAQLEYSFKG